MTNNTTIQLLSDSANDNARPAFRSIKDTLCDFCGRDEAVSEGRCGECIADGQAHVDERRGYQGDDC